MSDPIVPDPPPGNQPPNGAPPDTPANPPAPAKVEMTSDALAARLADERKKGEAAASAAMLKRLGVEAEKDAKALLEAAKAKADAELTETQRISKALEELKPRAARADALEGMLKALVDQQFDALPEGTRTAIDKVANGNPEERLRMIGVFREAGFLGAPTNGGAPPKTPPITTSPPSPPRPGGTSTKFDEWQALVTAGKQTAADLFFQYNRAAIEKSRPADQ